jgi:hypothetical protein
MTGANYWLVVAPVIFFLTLVFWVCLLLIAGQRKRDYAHKEAARKGPVEGAIVEGSPAQVNAGHFEDLPDMEKRSPGRPRRPPRRAHPLLTVLGLLAVRLLARAADRPGSHSRRRNNGR